MDLATQIILANWWRNRIQVGGDIHQLGDIYQGPQFEQPLIFLPFCIKGMRVLVKTCDQGWRMRSLFFSLTMVRHFSENFLGQKNYTFESCEQASAAKVCSHRRWSHTQKKMEKKSGSFTAGLNWKQPKPTSSKAGTRFFTDELVANNIGIPHESHLNPLIAV